MPEIEIIEARDETGSHFTLHHPYDLRGLDCELLDQSFPDRGSAEFAAEIVFMAVTGAVD
jgi:hypothetical protein